MPLLILHGFLGMSDNWRTHAKYWSSFYEVHAIDQRNHGRSFHSDVFDYNVLAQDIVHYMDEKSLSKAIVLGHSMGGKTAMTLALKFPNRVHKLIVADIAPKNYDVGGKFSSIIDGLLHLNSIRLTTRSEAENELLGFEDNSGVRQFLLKNLAWTDERTLELRCNIEVLQHKLNEIGAAPPTGTFYGETLFIGGAKSDYILKEDVANIQSYFPNALLSWVANAGHWLHAENPKGFTEALHDFLGN